jgi:hypothetical protein
MNEFKETIRFEEPGGEGGYGLMLVEEVEENTFTGKRLITIGTKLSSNQEDTGDMKLPMVKLTEVCIVLVNM